MTSYICGIFYAESKGEESKYANLRGSSSNQKFQEIYWKNLIVMYASAKKTNPNADLMLFTNSNPPKELMRDILSKLGVSIVSLQYKSRPRKNNWGFWQSTFYIIDAIEYLKERMAEEDSIIFLDLDCIVVKPLDGMLEILKGDGFLNFEMGYDESHQVHGLSRLNLKEMIEKTSSHSLPSVPKYFGGEIYGIHGKKNAEILFDKLKEAWSLSHTSQELVFHTEEHLFNYVFSLLGKIEGNANGYIKRIWTAYNYRNVEISDKQLTVWHLPSEKKHGMIKVYNDVVKDGGRFWKLDGELWVDYLGDKVTIPTRSYKRFITDITKNNIRKSTSALKRVRQ